MLTCKKLNILILTERFVHGGAETYNLTLAKKLKEDGNNITIVSEGGALTKEIVNLGIDHISLPTASFSIANIRKTAREVSKIIKGKRIDLIHTHPYAPIITTGLVTSLNPIPAILTIHGLGLNINYKEFLNLAFTHIIVTSKEIEDFLKKHFPLVRGRVKIIKNFIDTDLFKSESFVSSNDTPIITQITRLDSDRLCSVKELIRGVPKITRSFPKTEIWIAGGGSFTEEIKKIADKCNRTCEREVISVFGPKSNIQKIIAKSTIVIGVGRAALEGMSCSRPVMISGTEWYGGICTPRNYKKLSYSNFSGRGSDKKVTANHLSSDIKYLLKNPVLINKLGKFGRSMVLENHSLNEAIEEYKKVYISSIKKPPLNRKNRAKLYVAMQKFAIKSEFSSFSL